MQNQMFDAEDVSFPFQLLIALPRVYSLCSYADFFLFFFEYF